ncbi:MAG: hypothetical protein ACKO5K_13685 [Armatimonadota bacterium]
MTPPDWLEQLDTTDYARADAVARALVVRNDSDKPFDGVGRLAVDFRTRVTPPVRIETRDGAPVAARIDDEEVGPVEADGKRRWRFTLRFRIQLGPGGIDAWRAVWGREPGPVLGASPWPERTAWERECVPGSIPLPCTTDDVRCGGEAGDVPQRSE